MIPKKQNAEVRSFSISDQFQNIHGALNRLSVVDYTRLNNSRQCKKCCSDYMKFSIDGYCQKCVQRVEFIMRERPQILQKLKHRGGVK